MTDPQIAAAVVGILTAIGLLIGRIPVEPIALAVVRVIESHSSATASLIARIDACEDKHESSDAKIEAQEQRIAVLETQARADANAIRERNGTIETLTGRLKALREERAAEDRAEEAARHLRTTYRGAPPE